MTSTSPSGPRGSSREDPAGGGAASSPAEVERGRAAPRALAGGAGLALAVVGALLIAGLVAAFDETYEAVRDSTGLARIDEPMLEWMVAHRTPAGEAVVTAFTNLGSGAVMPVIATVVTLALARWWRSWTPIVLMLVATAGSLLITSMGKDAAGRTRPPQALAVPPYETSPSFPSGHTLNTTVICGVLIYLVLLYVQSLWARVVVVTGLVLFILAMGMSRVYLGHHWFTDVVAGWLIGTAWVLVVVLAHRLVVWLQRRQVDPDDTERRGASAQERGPLA